MTLSIMENHDAIKAALKDYQNTTGEIPKVLERYLEYVARTGKPLFSWDLISCLVMKKFENAFDDFVMEKPTQCIKNVNSDNLSVQDLKEECIKALNCLTGVPFTIQRVCELLLNPQKNYSKLEKFLRGFLRVIKVVTTVDRIGQKITTESQLFANAMSPFGINETGDNYSCFSSQSDESLTNIQLHSPADSAIDPKRDIDFMEDKLSQPMTISLPADSMDSYTTKMIDQEQQTSENMIYPNEQYFLEQKTISMPPIGALFKPIDQLEAFVQNVSNQVESSSSGSCSKSVEESKKRSATESDQEHLMEGDKQQQQQHLSSTEDIQEYISPAKKRKVELVPQEAVISSSDLSDPESCATKPEEEEEEVGGEIEAIPTMSSQVGMCVEEPSSTNEIKDDEEEEEECGDMEEEKTTSSSVELDRNEDGSQEVGVTEAIVDAGNPSNHAMEADQSNCDDLDEHQQAHGVEEVEGTNKDESLLSSSSSTCDHHEPSSIDEETGEHV